MKKRLLSLLVALCMAVTLLPVSAITAWAEESSSNSTTLRIEYGYPVGSGDNHDTDCSGDGWSYDGTTKTLKLNPTSPTEYDFSSLSSDGNTLDCALEIGAKATITSGSFTNDITNHGIVSGGTFSPIKSVKPCLTFANYGIITDGTFYAPLNTPSTSFKLSNYPSGTIEGGNFRNSSSNFSFSNQGSINGGIFSTAPDKSIKLGYILKCSGQLNDIFNATCYVIPNTNSTYPTKITASFDFGALSPFDVTINNTQQMLLTEWAGKVESSSDPDRLYVTFTAPPAKANTVTLSKLTRLVIDENGYPVGTEGGTQGYSGNGWSYNHTDKTLTLNPSTPTSYDFSGEGNALNPAVQLEVKSGAKLTGGAFKNEPTVKGAGTDPFKKVTLNGTGSITAVNGLASGDWGNTLYAVKTGSNTITASKPILDINRYVLESDDFLYPDSSNKSTISLNIEYLENINFIASDENIVLNQASYDLPLEMANDGTPIINDNAPYDGGGGYYNYYGDGWYVQKSSDGKSLGAYLTGEKTYNFRYTDPVKKTGQLDAVKCGIINEGSIIEDGIFNSLVANGLPDGDPTKTHKIEGGTFAAGLYYNNGEITGGAFNGKEDRIFTHETVLSGNYRSVTVNGGTIVKVNDTFPLVYDKTAYDLVQGTAWDLYSYAGTVLTVESNVDITNINGQKIGEAFSSRYPNGETDKKVVRFEMPDSDVELNSTKIVVPDPKPEPEAPTYTLTVKGGTFTYNGNEAMTSASVPVDAEVKVTLNQSAVPEGMVFDLWAMDEASLLGNPAVAYNQESFTIPAGSVAKGSTVTVEAQYRDATIESEPSILGTAAIIGVAGAGTAVIVWQGYRIGMELYEKYFQPTPEETAAEQPAPEAPAAAAAS